MKCCGRELTSMELQVAGDPYVLYRCATCDTTHWTRDGAVVPLEVVTAGLQSESQARAAKREAQQRS